MEDLSIAVQLMWLAAWGVLSALCLSQLRAWVKRRRERSEAEASERAALVARVKELEDEAARARNIREALAKDWRAKFNELELRVAGSEKSVTDKLGGTIASLQNRGYKR